MAIITRAQLSATANQRIGYRNLTAVLNEARSFETKSRATVKVFLSHSHKDKDDVEKAVAILRTLGVEVYVDWQDDSMPATTSGVTAARIKEKIRENRKFILLATNTAIASKWCNWELGYGDAQKYISHIALFPIADTAGGWQGNEYLQIYPRIEQNWADTFQVIFPDASSISLETWLRS